MSTAVPRPTSLSLKRTDIVGPKVPESFNVLVKELQGLGLKVDLVAEHGVVDAEDVLATTIHEEATHPAAVEVPEPSISDIDMSEETIGDDFSIVDADDESVLIDNDEVAVSAADAEEGRRPNMQPKKTQHGTNIADFDAVRLAVASPGDILDWSYGEVTKPETINYRTKARARRFVLRAHLWPR